MELEYSNKAENY